MGRRLALCLLICCQIYAQAEARDLKVPGNETGATLPYKLIRAVVERSDQYDGIEYPHSLLTGEVPFSKAVEDLNNGTLDLIWAGTNADFERQFQAVYVPLYRGTLGMRIGIVEQNRKDVLAGVTSLDGLRKFVPCQGKGWADTAILEANGILVAKSLKYPNLFAMLEADRCDYFPRAIFEPWSEVENNVQHRLTVDTHVMLRYTMPYLFFVRKGNTTLARHLTEVLAEMHQDGRFNELFFQDPDVKNALERANLKARRIFDLDNPTVTPEVRAIPRHFWYDPLEGTP